jgi:hypothetical protein
MMGATGIGPLPAVAQAQTDGQVARASAAGNRPDQSEKSPAPTKPGCIRLFGKEVCGTPETEVAANLIANGPSVSFGGDESNHSVQGFVRNGWPIVADFQPLPGSRTWLVVTLYDPAPLPIGRSIRLEMDHDGSTGRHYYKMPEVHLPDAGQTPDGKSAVRVASFAIESRMLDANGKPRGPSVPVQLFGLGAGPRAVGSVSLNGVKMGPAGSLKSGPVPYRYLLEQPFDLVSADVWRYCTKFLCNHVAFSERRQLVSGPSSGSFQPKKAGTYRLYVRAWLHCENSNVAACGDGAAWAAGESEKVTIPG